MQVNEALLHGWFFGNYWIRVAGAVVFGLAMGAIPFDTIAAWLFSGVDPQQRDRDVLMIAVRQMQRTVDIATYALDGVKGFVPTVIAAHGGGIWIGLSAFLAVLAGEAISPWSRRRSRPGFFAVLIGALIGLFVGLVPLLLVRGRD